jgi:transcription antitermination factor NusG
LRVRRPLFAGYVFACFDARRDRSGVLGVRGVVNVLSRGKTPEPLSDEVMAQLHAIARDPAAVGPAVWRAGEAVTVASGPLAGFTGVVERAKGARRLVILVGLLNRACAVEIGEADVYRASHT